MFRITGSKKRKQPIQTVSKICRPCSFYHLRSTKVLDNGDFFETEHLDESVDLASLMKEIVTEQIERKKIGRFDFNILMRPDHGHKILDDFSRDANPGYPLIGRLKGLTELSGLELGLRYTMKNQSI